MEIERRFSGVSILKDNPTWAFPLSGRLLLRDPVKSYVSGTRPDNTANLETKQISFGKEKSNVGKQNRQRVYPTKRPI